MSTKALEASFKVISTDLDYAFRNGVSHWLRPKFSRGKLLVVVIRRDFILEKLHLDRNALVALAVLSGSDYAQRTVKGFGISNAYLFVKKCCESRSVECIVDTCGSKKKLH